jgi:hypothetical protein
MIDKLFTIIEKFSRLMEKKKGDSCRMGKQENEEEQHHEFSEIVKKAYERGLCEGGITVQELIDDLKIDLMKITTNNI